MTKQLTGSARPAFQAALVLLFFCLFNAGVTATVSPQDVSSGHRYHDIEGGESQRSYRQDQTASSAPTFGKTTSQKRTINSFHHTQFNKIPTTAPIFLRGGSTKQRKTNARSAYRTNNENEKSISNHKSTTSSSTTSSLSSSSASASESWTRRDFGVFLSASFFMVLSASLVGFSPAPVLIAEIGSERATSTLSMIAACAALTEIIISPALGGLLDSIGRKPALVFALSCVSFFYGLVGIHSSVLTICAAKFVGMLCFGSFLTTSQVIVSDIAVSSPERMSQTLGMIYALSSSGFFIGAIAAGKLSEFGLSVNYRTSMVVSALTATLVFFGMKETLHSSKRIPFRENKTQLRKQLSQSPWSSCTRILFRHSKEVRILAILIMIQSLPSHMNDTFQILVRSEWNIDMKDFSSFFGMLGVVNILANIVGSQLVVKLGIKHFTAIATLSSVLSPIGASLLSFRGLTIGCLIGFLASAQMLGVTAALYVEGAKSNVPQGELAGERASFLALAKVIGPIWYSFLYVKGKKVFGTGFLPFWFNVGCGLTAFGISQRYLPS
jgi:MFS family permease